MSNRKPSDYVVLAAWHTNTGTHYYIEDQQRKAAEQNQPLDVLYMGWDGTWQRMAQLSAQHPFRTRHPEFASFLLPWGYWNARDQRKLLQNLATDATISDISVQVIKMIPGAQHDPEFHILLSEVQMHLAHTRKR
jgi:hypothetical protein